MKNCEYCHEPLAKGETQFHRECLVRMVAGSAAHQLGECSCFGGSREDPPGLSLRESAKLAAEACFLLRKRD